MENIVENSGQTLFEDQIITLEEVKTWTTEALKDYCQKRACCISGTRMELCARVYFLYNTKVPEELTLLQQEMSKKAEYKELLNVGTKASDPNKLKTWIGEKDGMKKWPPLCYNEIVRFISSNGHSLSCDALKSYKTGKAYSYFFNDWIQEVFYHDIKGTNVCFLKSCCTPSQRVNDPPHSQWIKVGKTDGKVESAFCSCVAGLSQTCNHVAALMFKIESAFRLELSNPASTSTACGWKAPGSKKPVFSKVEDLVFHKPNYKSGKVRFKTSRKISSAPYRQVSETLEEPGDTPSYKNFITTMKLSIPTALLFLPGKFATKAKQSEDPLPDVVVIDSQQDDGNPISNICNMVKVAESSATVEELLRKSHLSKEKITSIEINTRGQSNNIEWTKHRKGRLTASNFYRVHTKMETLKRKPDTDCYALVENILNPPDILHLAQISKGVTLEAAAISKLSSVLLEQGHSNGNIRNCGLFVDRQHQYLGASPDGMHSCDFCKTDKLVEIKCPSKELSCLPYLTNNNSGEKQQLKRKSAYYGQVQGQMLVTGIRQTYFFVFTEDSFFLQTVDFDEEFCCSMLLNLEMFFKQHLGPRMILGARK